MTKADLIEALYEKVGLSKKESSQIVENIFDIIREQLETGGKVKISGFFSKPDYLKSSRNMQVLYINSRHVEYKYLSYHISRAYEGFLSKGKYPIALVFVEIDAELVDVNIHPAKREVKIFDQKYIDKLIFSLHLFSISI